MSGLLSVPEAALALGVSERTIWRWLGSGRLSAERVGGRVLIHAPAPPWEHAVAGTIAPYRASGIAWRSDPEPGPWPYTAANLEKRKAILVAQRRRAADLMDRLGRETRPDPDGLTGVDYIRELRGPIGDDVEDETERSDG